jgi:hypothetical protein
MLIQRTKQQLDLFIEGDQLLFDKARNEIQKLLEFNHVFDVQINRLESLPLERGAKLRRIKNESN